MSENSKIQWTNNTGSPWFGCSPVSPGCANCYAWELMENRFGPECDPTKEPTTVVRRAYKKAGFEDWATRPVWGDKATRVLAKGFWTDAIRLDRAAVARGDRVKSFPSMIDWLDTMPAGIIDQDGKQLNPIAVLADFLDVIRRTPNTDHLLLTKRPENWRDRIAEAMVFLDKDIPVMSGEQQAEVLMAFATNSKAPDFIHQFKRSETSLWIGNWLEGNEPNNCWIGATVEDQTRADERIPHLLRIPARVRFLSVEPQLEAIDLEMALQDFQPLNPDMTRKPPPVQWVIVGGESGPKARPFQIEWARSIIAQCKAAGVSVFCKQLGAHPITEKWPKCEREFSNFGRVEDIKLRDKKGGDMSEWSQDLRVREFPTI